MSDLTPERRADLRMLLGDLDAHLAMDPRPSTAVPFAALLDAALPALPALLDAADELDRIQQEKKAEQVERIKAEHLRFRVSGKYYCVVDEMDWPCLSIRNLEPPP